MIWDNDYSCNTIRTNAKIISATGDTTGNGDCSENGLNWELEIVYKRATTNDRLLEDRPCPHTAE